MAYTPTEWATGDVITATKLNNMEQGIEDAFVAPAVTIADEGDVLTVNSSGAWAAAAPASQLPAVTSSDAGDVLTVNSSGEWAAAAPASQLPEVTAADQGKVLTVDSSGDWDAAAPEKEVAEVSIAMLVNTTTLQPQQLVNPTGDIETMNTAKVAVAHVTLYSSVDTQLTTPLMTIDLYRRRIPVGNSDVFVLFDGVLMLATSPSVVIAFGQISYNMSTENWNYTSFYPLTIQSS